MEFNQIRKAALIAGGLYALPAAPVVLSNFLELDAERADLQGMHMSDEKKEEIFRRRALDPVTVYRSEVDTPWEAVNPMYLVPATVSYCLFTPYKEKVDDAIAVTSDILNLP